MQESGGLQSDGGTEQSSPAHEQSTQTGDYPIGIAQLRRALAAAIQDRQLMSDQHGFRNHGAQSTRPSQTGQRDDQMNK